jgi:hypothetical protein
MVGSATPPYALTKLRGIEYQADDRSWTNIREGREGS